MIDVLWETNLHGKFDKNAYEGSHRSLKVWKKSKILSLKNDLEKYKISQMSCKSLKFNQIAEFSGEKLPR